MTSELSDLREQLEKSQRELAEQTAVADLGETAAILAHEFNNYLNTVALQLAILESQVPKNFSSELAALRDHGTRMARLVRMWQETRRPADAPSSVDLNHLVEAAAESRVELRLASEPLLVAGSAATVRRLCSFMIKNAIMASEATGGKTVVRTQRKVHRVVLEVEDAGPPIDPKCLSDGGMIHREQTNELQLAVCKRIVQRLQGEMEVTNRRNGGVTMVVELPAAAP